MKTATRAMLMAGASALVLSGAVALAGPKHADRGEGGPGPRWGLERMDADGDGRITLDEFRQARAGRFDDLDADGDGVLSAEELAARGRQKAERLAERMLARLDEDDSGDVSQEEFLARAERGFSRLDISEDGELTGRELQGPRRGHAPRHGWKGGRGGDRHHGERFGAGGPGGRMFARLDADEDGRVSEEEFAAMRRQQFERFDADGDGTVTRAEVDAAIAERLERMQARMQERMQHRLGVEEDAELTFEAFSARAEDMFQRFDTDGNGFVSREEIRQMHPGHGSGWKHHRSGLRGGE